MSSTISLSFKAITDEIMALTALRKVSAPDPSEGMLVNRDQLTGLRVLARMVFAETLIRLGSLVQSSQIDQADILPDYPYDPDSQPTLKLTFAMDLNNGKLLTVKRHLEHILAFGILALVATEADGDFASRLSIQQKAAETALSEALESEAMRTGFATGCSRPRWL